MDISFEILILSNQLCFFNNGLMAAHLYGAPLMKGKCTEITPSETTTIAD